MARPLPLARDAVFVCAGAQRTIAVGSTDWYDWLSEIDHRSFQFASEAGGFTARKERRSRGGWYWIAYRRFQGNIHKSYLGKSEEVTLARLQDAAAILAARIEALGAPRDRASPTVYTPAVPVPVTAIQRSAGAAWPSGTVTFLFTDIAGSTQLWEQHPQTMPQAIARHDALLRQAVEARGGVVFKTVGDAVCAAFSSAPAAIAAALAGQRALRAEAWNLTDPLLVRMALHTGTVEMRDGDYLGPPLNRVARLLATGYGGQVLLSHATADLVGDALTAGASLRDLGVYTLKDLICPEQIYQLTSPDLPDDFPPLRAAADQPAAATPPAQILSTKLYTPRARPNLVPRPQLIARLQAGLAGKLTLISAPAGFGKTTLLAYWLTKLRIENEELRKLDQDADSQFSIFNFQFKVAWIALDVGDNDPNTFLRYLIAALQMIAADVGATALALLQTSQPSAPEAVLTPLLNDLAALQEHHMLVLDDYHVIAAPAIHQAVIFLLDHLPPSLHLVILTRADPPLPLARLRARCLDRAARRRLALHTGGSRAVSHGGHGIAPYCGRGGGAGGAHGGLDRRPAVRRAGHAAPR